MVSRRAKHCHKSQTKDIGLPLFAQRVIYTKCLEGTTERSDGNRARSVRLNKDGTMCLEGTTPKNKLQGAHSDISILLPFPQSQTNVIAFRLSAQSVILPFAIFTHLLSRKF